MCGIRLISLKGAGCVIIAYCLHHCLNASFQSCLPLINFDVYVFQCADDNVKAAYNFKRSVTLFAIFYPVLHMCENVDVFLQTH